MSSCFMNSLLDNFSLLNYLYAAVKKLVDHVYVDLYLDSILIH